MPPRAEEGSRTPDLLITNQLLYQLSYFGLTHPNHQPHITLIYCFFWEGKGRYYCEIQKN
jgi:hypothetical protein